MFMLININVYMVLLFVCGTILNIILFKYTYKFPTDFELSTFITIIVTRFFGLHWGIVSAILIKVVTSIGTNNFKVTHIGMIFSFVIAAIIANYTKALPILVVGILISLINAFYMYFVELHLFGIDMPRNLVYKISQISLTIFLFLIFGNILDSIYTY